MGNLVQLYEIIGNDAGASNKARSDIRIISEKLEFSTVPVKTVIGHGTIKYLDKLIYLNNLRKALNSIEKESILLVQVPVLNLAGKSHNLILDYGKRKKLNLICIIHDLNDIRANLSPETNSELYSLLKEARVVISHNVKMTNYLTDQGIEKEKIVNLELFDYLLDKECEIGSFSKLVTIAGNLDTRKVGYIGKIKEVSDVTFELYGPNYDEDCGGKNIKYNGVVNSSNLPYLLNKGFGLVWDGNSIMTCDGNYGHYLKYNNPHKLSLYIASGLPVIIWSEAAEAKFVQNNHIGVAVSSLMDLPNVINGIKEDDYKKLLYNVRRIQKKVISGGFMTQALEQALHYVEKTEDNSKCQMKKVK